MATVIPLHAPSVTTRTTCPYCGVGCGVRATRHADGRVEVAGDPDHPANRGKLCVKGSSLADTLDLDGRLLYPMRREHGQLRRIGWEEALDEVASGLRRIVDAHGPDSVAMYVSGQLLTEDYYVANKLMKGYVGTANIDTNSRLCMSSAVAGHKRAFGEDLVPVSYADLEQADLVVLVGSNTAWCHPILFQRLVAAREARPQMRLVVIDPRRTATCELADLHLPVRPGTDVALFNGLLRHLERAGKRDAAFVADHTAQVEAALAAAAPEDDIDAVARRCGIGADALRAFYDIVADTPRTITAFSMGVNQSSAGTDKVNAIINTHLLTGRIGQPGMGPFSITGQPNAMGGREVGGLANMLAAHLDIDNAAHRNLVQGFWQSPVMASKGGLKAVDLFEAVEAGRVKAIWIMGTNPVVSMPDADRVRRALQNCKLVIASDIVRDTDTNACADILLPALGWGEKDGTVTNSERRVSRQRAFLPAPGEARADWDIICEVARRMGYDAFDYAGPAPIFAEHAALSAHRNVPGDTPRRFDIGGLAGLTSAGYDALTPVQWPQRAGAHDTAPASDSLLADRRFSFPDGRARFVPTLARPAVHAPDGEHPLVLNTGRVRDHWHTMTRTGKAARLAEHLAESFVDMHPQDALLCGVREGELARVATRWGAMVAKVRHDGAMARGQVFVPIHWNDRFASDARVGALVNPVVDPVSGEPEFKHTPAAVTPFPVDWHGFVLSREPVHADALTYWTRVTGNNAVRHEFAGRRPIGDYRAWALALLGLTDMPEDWLEYEDATAGQYRATWMIDGRVQACLFVSARPDLPARSWLTGLFDKATLDEEDRVGLLVGQPITRGADTGPTVCACFGVGRETICDAIRQRGLSTPAEVTACTKAGGNCGSCVPEIKRLIVQVAERAA